VSPPAANGHGIDAGMSRPKIHGFDQLRSSATIALLRPPQAEKSNVSLAEIDLDVNWSVLPDDVAAFLAQADGQVDHFVEKRAHSYRGFVPSDFVTLYHALRSITTSGLASGNSFCEWGSGLGVVASLAAMLGLDAVGIEIDRDLFDAANELADEFDIPVEFVNGSFVPQGSDAIVDGAYAECDGALSLDPHADDAYDELGLEVRDFDLIFAFPWPNDEELTASLFEHFAAEGALLLTYVESEAVCLRRKC
jgi:hypothetical protein